MHGHAPGTRLQFAAYGKSSCYINLLIWTRSVCVKLPQVPLHLHWQRISWSKVAWETLGFNLFVCTYTGENGVTHTHICNLQPSRAGPKDVSFRATQETLHYVAKDGSDWLHCMYTGIWLNCIVRTKTPACRKWNGKVWVLWKAYVILWSGLAPMDGILKISSGICWEPWVIEILHAQCLDRTSWKNVLN